MFYSDIIPLLDYELRDTEAWPSDTSKIDEQINLLYISALTVGRELPLNRLPLIESASALTGSVVTGVITRYDLKQANVSIFDLRYSPELGILDMGIDSLRLDGKDYSLSQAISLDTLLAIGNNGIHKSRILFALNLPGGFIYATNVNTFKLYYAQKFIRPTNTGSGVSPDYDKLGWPLTNDTDTERAINLVAAHVNGVTIHDSGGAQFEALLEKIYAG